MSRLTAAVTTAPDAPEGEELGKTLLQRIILPRPGEPLDVRTLYIEESTTNARRAHASSRTELNIGAESEVSLCTYFNAFPASYWRRWSTLNSVVLRLELTGHGRIDIYRSKADSSRIHVQGREFQGTGVVLELETDLGPFEDGGWIWFDVTTDTDVTVHSAGWFAPVEAPGKASVAVGIPTFNRPADCVAALRALASDPLVMDVIDAMIIPDQGTRKVRDQDGFAEAAEPFGDRLVIHDQANLGGSGGYSRIMYEALKTTDAPYILFMDDDIEIEPDSILRALAFSRFAKSPTLVGGRCSTCRNAATCTRWVRSSTGRSSCGRPPRMSSTTTTSPRIRCAIARTRSCCIDASTSTSTAGGCA